MPLTRRDFLTLLGALVVFPAARPFTQPFQLGRVTAARLTIRSQPDFDAPAVAVRTRDEVLNLYYPLDSTPDAPPWYRTWGGYVYGAFLHPCRATRSTPLARIPAGGLLGEVCMPFVDSLQMQRGGFAPACRLYYGSTHWLVDVRPGPDGAPCYAVEDVFERTCYVPAAALRPIPEAELAPIDPHITGGDKFIRVSLGQQMLWAYQQGQVVLQTRISAGVAQNEAPAEGEFSTDTPLGDYHITVKTPSRHMGAKGLLPSPLNPALSSPPPPFLNGEPLPGVPWVSFFKEEGYSLHGTFWHNNFGQRMSHGCVNMPTALARWVYRWAEPYTPAGARWHSAWGTRVSVVE